MVMEERPQCVGKRKRGWKIIRILGYAFLGIIVAALFALILGFVVKWLWNWLMPDIFGLRQISYWQAFGLLVLAKLLFGRFSHDGHDLHDHRFGKGLFHGHEERFGRRRRWRECGWGPKGRTEEGGENGQAGTV